MDENTQALLLNTQGPGNGSWIYLQNEDAEEQPDTHYHTAITVRLNANVTRNNTTCNLRSKHNTCHKR
eukprot:6148302-Prorocentrum_lima.AAC.1